MRSPVDPVDDVGKVRTMDSYYSQSLSWSRCGKGECARIAVPLDYEDLRAGTLRLKVERVAAKGGHGRPLFFNPGGPGGSAAGSPTEDLAKDLTKPMREAFDVVGMDPRGTGEGAPVDCVSDRSTDRLYTQDPSPDDATEVAAFWKVWREFGASCLESSPGLSMHVSTEEAARDFDIARAALGAKRLDFVGYSYGAQLGATYATLFPRKVGHMVLDGGFDSSLTWTDAWAQQSKGFHVALQHYAQDCIQHDCPLGDSESEVFNAMRVVLDQADHRSIPAKGKPELTEGLAYTGIFYATYGADLWPDLTAALVAAQAGNGTKLRTMAFEYLGRNPDGTYLDNINEAFPTISCNDASERLTARQVRAVVPRFVKGSPLLGRADAWTMTSVCAGFPPALHPQMKVHAPNARPILVLGSTGDPATPIAWSEALTSQLGSAVLLTRQGEGHLSYAPEYRCTTRHVDRYFLDGVLPKRGTTCTE
jgi:pimeloyl-ACP methyl ester carboxylesterase